jgi:predicted nucleotidyltransferase
LNNDWLSRDNVLNKAYNTIEKCAQIVNVDVVSIVLFGSRVKKGNFSQGEYELLVIVPNDIGLDKYIKFCETTKIHMLASKLYNVKVLTYTLDIFENILYGDNIIDAFLYMIMTENIILYDNSNVFYKSVLILHAC